VFVLTGYSRSVSILSLLVNECMLKHFDAVLRLPFESPFRAWELACECRIIESIATINLKLDFSLRCIRALFIHFKFILLLQTSKVHMLNA
jgi:hypothetical protein